MLLLFCLSVMLFGSGVVPNDVERENPKAVTDVREKVTEIYTKTRERASKYSENKPLASELAWPCPVDELIVPCTCKSNDVNYEVNIDCSAANSEVEIETAFSSIFPFDDVMSFTVNNEDMINDIESLPEGIFDVKSFSSVEIVGTMLKTVGDNVLVYSHPTLIFLSVSNNKLQSFPFQTVERYENLINLDLSNNELSEIPIELSSNSLRILNMRSNANLEFQETTNTFLGVPELRQLILANIGLKTLRPYMFSPLSYISEIYLSGNSLIELDENAFYTPTSSVQTLFLADNMITTVHPGAITGLRSDGILDLTRNNITVLDQNTWEPIFVQVLEAGEIVLDENPLTCGCDFKWIVNNTNYLELISIGSTCYAGVPVSQIDKDFIIQNCD